MAPSHPLLKFKLGHYQDCRTAGYLGTEVETVHAAGSCGEGDAPGGPCQAAPAAPSRRLPATQTGCSRASSAYERGTRRALVQDLRACGGSRLTLAFIAPRIFAAIIANLLTKPWPAAPFAAARSAGSPLRRGRGHLAAAGVRGRGLPKCA